MEKSIKRYMPIFVLPTFFAFILGFIVPFIMGIWLSFCKFTTVTDAKFVGFSNYIEALKDTAFRHSFWYTFYGRTGWEGVGQAKAVIFFAIVVVIGMIQLRATRSKEVQQ